MIHRRFEHINMEQPRVIASLKNFQECLRFSKQGNTFWRSFLGTQNVIQYQHIFKLVSVKLCLRRVETRVERKQQEQEK